MTKLTTYTVILSHRRDSASDEIDAPSPRPRSPRPAPSMMTATAWSALYFEPYAGYSPVDEIVVDAPDGERVAEWLSPDLLLRLAAEDLFNALEKALTALNTAPRSRCQTVHRQLRHRRRVRARHRQGQG